MEKPFTILARLLRKNSTEVEQLLWRHLRDKQFHGLKFKRQQPLDSKYIVDFICLEKRLVIELDGGQHTAQEAKEKDAERDEYLAENGFRILRFWNNEVLSNLSGVLQAISDACSSPHPNPLPQARGRCLRQGEGEKRDNNRDPQDQGYAGAAEAER